MVVDEPTYRYFQPGAWLPTCSPYPSVWRVAAWSRGFLVRQSVRTGGLSGMDWFGVP